MDFSGVAFSIILFTPLLVGFSNLLRIQLIDDFRRRIIFLSGSIVPFIVSLVLGILIYDEGVLVFKIPFLRVLDLSWSLEVTGLHLIMFSVVLSCFVLGQALTWMQKKSSIGLMSIVLVLQSTCSFLFFSRNLLITAFLQCVAAFTLFLIFKLSLSDEDKPAQDRCLAPERFLGTQFFSAILVILISSAVAFKYGHKTFEFSGLNSVHTAFSGDPIFKYVNLFFLAPLIIGLPVVPWVHWLGPLFERRKLAPSINVFTSAYLGILLFLYFEIFETVLGGAIREYKIIMPAIGILLCVLNLIFGVIEKTPRRKFSYLSSYLMAFCVYSMGFLQKNTYYIGLLMLMLLPLLSLIYEDFCNDRRHSKLRKVLFVFLALYAIGVPGSPIYFVFALTSTAALEGVFTLSYAALLLWLLYLLLAIVCIHSIWKSESSEDLWTKTDATVSFPFYNELLRTVGMGLFLVCMVSIFVCNFLGSLIV